MLNLGVWSGVEAVAVYEEGREAVVAVLVALSVRIAAQDALIARLRRGSRVWSAG